MMQKLNIGNILVMGTSLEIKLLVFSHLQVTLNNMPSGELLPFLSKFISY